ncbi:hypothetical protein Misp06_04304 [Microbulbifer sp. NBRC 101763]|uniref:hypothetical protein n=1 Tax=Microbulbifer sp. NBRC 101763 TaxID=1113820 RepID=UPI0030AD0F4D
MVSAETLMEQAGDTVTVWLNQAQQAVSGMDLSDEAKAQIISAFIQAAAQDQHTMTIRALAENQLLAGVS